MLSGSRPFAGATPGEVCAAIPNREPAPLTEHRLAPIVDRALAKDRDRRYQTAAEVRDDLAAVLAPPVEPGRWRRAALILVPLSVILVIAGLWFWNSRRGATILPQNFKAVTAQKLTDMPGQEIFPSLAPDAQRLIFASPQQGNWDIYVQTVGEHTATNLTPDSPGFDIQPVYSPDGRRIAFSSNRDGGGVFLMNSDGSNVTKLTDADSTPRGRPTGTRWPLPTTYLGL
jgi:hypothetical protein